jgi:hypothetical protein
MEIARMNATGRCLCGAVTFTAEGVDQALHVCHCSMCRRWAGGPTFCMNVERVTFRGDEHIRSYESSAWAERGFCERCGSNLFYRLKEQNQYILNMGSFDDQTQFSVASEIFVDDKPPAYSMAGAHPRLTGEEFLASLKTQ